MRQEQDTAHLCYNTLRMEKVCTLLFLVQKGQILLAMKKRGFGSDRWNGVGGKVEPDEAIEQALIRECQEEITVTPIAFHKVAIHDFVFPNGMNNMQIHTYLCSEWQGEPAETEEMAPRWFSIDQIPYDHMWQDDKQWLPQVLEGKQLHTRFVFDTNEQLVESHVHEAVL